MAADDLDIVGPAKKDDDSSNGWLWGLGLGILGIGVTAAVIGGSKTPAKPDPKPDPPGPNPPAPDPNPPAPDPDPPAPDPNPPTVLRFDLVDNWGAVPDFLRPDFAKLELAARIPGIGRIAAIKAWQAFRANQPYLSMADAAALYAANPDLNREVIAEIDAQAAKDGLDNGIAQGWPKPNDYDGYARGSFGFFDILGSNIAYAGVHTEPLDKLPFVDLDSTLAGANLQVQFDTFSYMIWRILQAPGYKVLVPGINAPPDTANSLQTWGNIMSAYANPTAYMQQTPSAIAAKQRFLERALELGIDLAKVKYPWPPGTSYSKATWKFRDVVARLDSYKDLEVQHEPSGFVQQPPQLGDQNADQLADLGGGIKARIVTNGVQTGAPAPLMLVLHDRGANETQLQALVAGAVNGTRIAFLRAPIAGQGGFRWFDATVQTPSPAIDLAVTGSASQVAGALDKLRQVFPATIDVAVVGFGQGGAVAYKLAADTAKQPGLVNRVLAIGAWLPAALRPVDGDKITAAVYGIHGSADVVVPLAKDQETIQSFIFKAGTAELEVVAGGTHNLTTLAAAVTARLKG